MYKLNNYQKEILQWHNTGISSRAIVKMLKENFKLKVDKSTINRNLKIWKKDLNYGVAKILIFDLETAPLRAFIWSKWQNGVQDSQIISDWFILTFSAKWLFDDKIISERLTGKEALASDDSRIVKKLWNLMDEADIVIAHNLMKFDRKKANTRFFKHDLKLPSPVQYIDTLLHARRQFAITSNKLDYISQNFLGIEGKMETPKGLWEKAMNGDDDALDTMRIYCDQDVRVLEDVYLLLRPYIQPHPNMGLFIEDSVSCCPSCGSEELSFIGEYATYVNTYDALRCNECGSISRSRQSNTPIKTKKQLKVSIPK